MNSLPKSNLVERLTFTNNFKLYLEDLGLCQRTIINYLSDLSHFSGWAMLQLKAQSLEIKNSEDIIEYFSSDLLNDYKGFLGKNQKSIATSNRRLSALRSLGKFLVLKGHIRQNPADELNNLKNYQISHKLVERFREHLEKNRFAPKTIKNYICDIQGFLKFLEKQEFGS